MKIKTFKKDEYTLNRGGYSRLLNLHCQKCEHIFATYQKDGPGNLRRLYLDRILIPENISYQKSLKCNHCSFIIGEPYIYDKENRKAFRVYQDAIKKEIRPLDK